MVQINIEKILIFLIVLIIPVGIFFFWLRMMSKKKAKEKLKELQKDLGKFSKSKGKKIPKKDRLLLNRVVKEIKNAADKGKEVVRLSLDKDVDLKIETPDVIALRTPRETLHKSFSEIRFWKIEKTGDGIRLHFKAG